MNSKKRLDKYLVDNLKVTSRNLAQKLINENKISINNLIVNKTNYLVKDQDIVMIIEEEKYVSRAAYKLLFALNNFKVNLYNKTIIDIGSSTGGFTQVCLEHNARKIYCIDVGKNQLSEKLRSNKKIELHEETNFKDIDKSKFNDIDFITCDVSFISIRKILSKIKEMDWKNINGIFLLKPQFELSPKEISIGKGKVKNQFIDKVIKEFKNYCNENNFQILEFIESPIKGAKKNNTEYLVYLRI